MVAHTSTFSQTWPAFALVAGLLLVGAVAAADGLFEWLGARLANLPGNNLALLCYLLALVAATTVVLNLDTSVVFVTPVVLQAARSRCVEETGFLYGSVFMANSASLLLPGSNLTNLLVLANEPVSGHEFARYMLPPWVAAVFVTAGVVIVWRRNDLRRPRQRVVQPDRPVLGLGLVGTAGSAVLVLLLSRPAVPVLALGFGVAGAQVALHRMQLETARRALSPWLLGGLFALALALGAGARDWGALSSFMASIGQAATSAVAAGASVVVNNLPAAVVLSAGAPAHPGPLLLGLNLGPNLAVSGSLAALLWLRISRSSGAEPSALTYSRVGAVIAPLSIALGLAALHLFSPASL